MNRIILNLKSVDFSVNYIFQEGEYGTGDPIIEMVITDDNSFAVVKDHIKELIKKYMMEKGMDIKDITPIGILELISNESLSKILHSNDDHMTKYIKNGDSYFVTYLDGDVNDDGDTLFKLSLVMDNLIKV